MRFFTLFGFVFAFLLTWAALAIKENRELSARTVGQLESYPKFAHQQEVVISAYAPMPHDPVEQRRRVPSPPEVPTPVVLEPAPDPEPIVEAVPLVELRVENLLVMSGKSFTIPGLDIEMVWLEQLQGWVSRGEITQGQYHQLGGSSPHRFSGTGLPADSVSWTKAVSYCEQLNLREEAADRLPPGYTYNLPTEAQWKIYVGDADASQSIHSRRSSVGPEVVGNRAENNHGLVDTRGNLWEWTLDDHDPNRPERGKALRGGSYANKASLVMNNYARYYGGLDSSYYEYGFRIVLVNEAQ